MKNHRMEWATAATGYPIFRQTSITATVAKTLNGGRGQNPGATLDFHPPVLENQRFWPILKNSQVSTRHDFLHLFATNAFCVQATTIRTSSGTERDCSQPLDILQDYLDAYKVA